MNLKNKIKKILKTKTELVPTLTLAYKQEISNPKKLNLWIDIDLDEIVEALIQSNDIIIKEK